MGTETIIAYSGTNDHPISTKKAIMPRHLIKISHKLGTIFFSLGFNDYGSDEA